MTPRADPPPWAAIATILVLALAGAAAGLWAGQAWFGGRGSSVPTEAEVAPPLALADLDGVVRRLDDYRGQVVLINFWATWCRPCIEELPLLQALHDGKAEHGVQVLTIAQEEDAEGVRAFLDRLKVDLPVWLDPPSQGEASRLFGNDRQVLPFSVLVGPDGRVLQRRAGMFSEAELERWRDLGTASLEQRTPKA